MENKTKPSKCVIFVLSLLKKLSSGKGRWTTFVVFGRKHVELQTKILYIELAASKRFHVLLSIHTWILYQFQETELAILN